MDILLVFAGTILIYTLYKQFVTEPSYEEILQSQNDTLNIGDYNPYALNQYAEWKDRIHSADVNENDIYAKPVQIETGLYAIIEDQIKLNPVDIKTIVNRRDNLNL